MLQTPFNHFNSFAEERHQQTVDNESRSVFASDCDLANCFTPGHAGVIGVIRCIFSSDYLKEYKLHDHQVEKCVF